MKKIFNILLLAATALGFTTSCSDVPAPYDIYANGNASYGKTLPYKSASLNTGWTTHTITADEPWSQGSSYTQATGYQDWDGTGSKVNHEVESYLISPALNLKCESGKVKFNFDQTIRYTNNVSGWANNHKIFISKDYDGMDFDAATWEELPFTPEASPYSDWTLYTSGDIQIPDAYVNHDSVYVAFWFYAPASASTTWELENFFILEGEAENNNTPSSEKTLPYLSSNLNADWTIYSTTENNPWSQGSSYTQATGYQNWDGTGSKYNKEVDGYLISPAINTKCESGKVKINFDQTIRYTNNVSGWENNHKVYISGNYDGQKFDAATWEELPYKPEASPYTDWTLYNSGDIQIPDAYVGQDSIYVAFWFHAPASASTTWELENFNMLEGEAGITPDNPNPTPTEGSGSGTKSDPYNVAAIISFAKAGNYSNDNPSATVYVKGIVSNIGKLQDKYGELDYYISDDGTTGNEFFIYGGYGLNGEKITSSDYLKVGDEVLVAGQVVTYNGTHEFKYGSKIIILNGSTEGGGNNDNPDTPSGGSDGVSISGTTVTLTNAAATPGNESITIDLNTLGYENAADMGTVTLNDGTTIVFDAGSNKNAPKFYSATKGARVYANNTITFNGKSAIATIVMTCDSYNGTDYVGNATATISASGNTLVYTNASADAGTQLRVQTITITYAQ
ncbi:MAG: DUF5017 domain-containing protein [Bacteroidaceae bacterium]|nr:DUF5017 domain-containing protein [Bacteroidaceae bacterium]